MTIPVTSSEGVVRRQMSPTVFYPYDSKSGRLTTFSPWFETQGTTESSSYREQWWDTKHKYSVGMVKDKSRGFSRKPSFCSGVSHLPADTGKEEHERVACKWSVGDAYEETHTYHTHHLIKFICTIRLDEGPFKNPTTLNCYVCRQILCHATSFL